RLPALLAGGRARVREHGDGAGAGGDAERRQHVAHLVLELVAGEQAARAARHRLEDAIAAQQRLLRLAALAHVARDAEEAEDATVAALARQHAILDPVPRAAVE